MNTLDDNFRLVVIRDLLEQWMTDSKTTHLLRQQLVRFRAQAQRVQERESPTNDPLFESENID